MSGNDPPYSPLQFQSIITIYDYNPPTCQLCESLYFILVMSTQSLGVDINLILSILTLFCISYLILVMVVPDLRVRG